MIGVSILGFFGVRKCYRLYQKQMLMKNNPVVEIADLNIKAPIVACHAKRKKLTRKTKKTLLNTTFKSVFYYL